MSTVRIQVRRGISTDWSTVNPTLAAGEIGFESNTKKVKIGDGTTAWNSLDYISSDVPVIDEIAQDAVNSALVMGNGLSKVYNDPANTITLSNTGVLSFNTRTGSVTLSDTDVNTALGYTAADAAELSNFQTVAAGDIADAITTAENYTDNRISILSTTDIPEDQNLYFTADRARQAMNGHLLASDGIIINYNPSTKTFNIGTNILGSNQITTWYDNNGAANFTLAENITIPGQFISDSIETNSITVDGNINAVNLTLSGDLNVNGTTTTVNSNTMNVTDPIIYMANGNQTNVVDIGMVGAFNDGTYQHTGLVKDSTDGIWKLFSGLTTEPGSVIDFTSTVRDSIQVDGINANVARIGNVTNTEIQRLSGVSSNIQDQINLKLSSDNASTTYALIYEGTLFQPTITDLTVEGTLSIPLQSINANKIESHSITNDQISLNANISISKIQDLENQLSALAPLNNPIFTGTVSLPMQTSIGPVTKYEIGFLEGVSSNIQNQLDDITTDVSTVTSNLSTHSSATTNVHGISNTANLATKSYADNSAASALSDAESYADGLAANYDPAGSASTAQSAAATYTDNKISTEVTNRNSAISSAISTEVTNRNNAISSSASTTESNANNYTEIGRAHV